MSLKSMTGFGRSEGSTDQFYIVCEVKTVNNRFKDYRFRMPSYLSSFEMSFRKKLDAYFVRGSIDVSIQIRKNPSSEEIFNIDYEKVQSFLNSFERNIPGAHIGEVNPTDFLRNDFSKDQDDKEREILGTKVESILEEAAERNISSRKTEGSKLENVFLQQIEAYKELLAEVETLRKSFQKEVQEKLLKKFEENRHLIESDDARFQKEVIFYLEKLDIDEEVDRAQIHLSKLVKVLSGNKGKEQGRELEFLLQELNRETNTIGSKSSHEAISDKVIKMKVCMEKMREQALNIE